MHPIRVGVVVLGFAAMACGARSGLEGDESGDGGTSTSDTATGSDTGTGGGGDPTDQCQYADHAMFDTPTGFPAPCDPSADDSPPGFLCCSDDPSAAGGNLPAYVGRYQGSDTAVPFFSGASNALSQWGICLQDGYLTPDVGLIEPGADGCPVPCNPQWSAEDVGKVCGVGMLCCQTQELGPDDCVFDSNTQCWRPATGADIFDPDVQGTTFPQGTGDPWKPDSHDTHQDPNGTNCSVFAGGDTGLRNDCFQNLRVADQRGFCLQKSATIVACPLAQPGYVDACEQRNIDEGRDGC